MFTDLGRESSHTLLFASDCCSPTLALYRPRLLINDSSEGLVVHRCRKFDWLNETERATRLESPVARVIAEGKVRTYDMGGSASTLEVAKAVADYAG